MYKIDIKSVDESGDSPYKTVVTIVTEADLVRVSLQWNITYLVVFQNPLLKFFIGNSMLIYTSKMFHIEATINQILTVNEGIKFSFNKESHRTYFEQKAPAILQKIIDKKVSRFKKNPPISLGDTHVLEER